MSHRMSVTYFLLFLCISLHASEARNVGTSDQKMEKQSHFIPKNDENYGFGDSSPKKLGLKNNGDNEMKVEFVVITEKPKESKNMDKKSHLPKSDEKNGFDGLKNSGIKAEFVANTEKPKESKNMGKYEEHPPVSDYWGMPPMEYNEGNSRFSLDYPPPETHPPSHNDHEEH